MKRANRTSILILLGLGLASGNLTLADDIGPSDAVSDWMELSAQHRDDLFQRTAATARTDSTVALAMFEAANAIERKYPSRLGIEAADGPSDVDIAVAVAARTVLETLYPDAADVFAQAFAAHTGRVASDDTFDRSRRLGERTARAALTRGQAMREERKLPYRVSTPPGAYVPEGTPSLIRDFDFALVPWAIRDMATVRPPPPPGIRSKRYAEDLLEVQRLGAKIGSSRTPHDTETARYWFFIDLNPVLRQICERPGRSVADNARLYAMFYMASDDAWLASIEAKTHYQFWRPVTAIRAADRDGNRRTTRDPYWTPFMPTPPHPEYPCAHCLQAAAQAAIVDAELGGDPLPFGIASSTLPNARVRTVTLDEYVQQTAMSRIYAGAHYRFSNDAGIEAGAKVARAVMAEWDKR